MKPSRPRRTRRLWISAAAVRPPTWMKWSGVAGRLPVDTVAGDFVARYGQFVLSQFSGTPVFQIRMGPLTQCLPRYCKGTILGGW